MPLAPSMLSVAELLSRLGTLAGRAYSQRVAAFGLSPGQVAVLRAVATTPGRSQQAIAADLGAVPSRIVALVDDLGEVELIERRRSPTDRRLNALFVTPTGQQRLNDLTQMGLVHDDAVCDGLSPTEREQLRRLLTRLAELRQLGAPRPRHQRLKSTG